MKPRDYGEVADVVARLPDTVVFATRLFNVSQNEIARRAGVSPATMTRLTHNQDVKMSSVIAILRALNDLAPRG